MTVTQLILVALVVAVAVAIVVGAITWFGPRRRQWKTHDGDD